VAADPKEDYRGPEISRPTMGGHSCKLGNSISAEQGGPYERQKPLVVVRLSLAAEIAKRGTA